MYPFIYSWRLVLDQILFIQMSAQYKHIDLCFNLYGFALLTVQNGCSILFLAVNYLAK